LSSSITANVPQGYCCNNITSLSSVASSLYPKTPSKDFCPLSSLWFCFCPPCHALGCWHVPRTGLCRQASRLPPSFGRARAGRGMGILAEPKKPAARYASCGNTLLGRTVLPAGADLPALHRLMSSFPGGVEGGGKTKKIPKNPTKKSS